MIQPLNELEDWYSTPDPWDYYKNPQDEMRLSRVLAAIPAGKYEHALDIGCGNGFVTNALPAEHIIGVDVSENAINWAKKNAPAHVDYRCASLFDLNDMELPKMDLILITGVLYPQYIASSIRLVYVLIDKILKPGGVLVCSHIFEWYKGRFPYLTISRELFQYRDYYQVLEVYAK